MKRAVQAVMLIAAFSLLVPAGNAQKKKMMMMKFQANLEGNSQVPPVATSASGHAMFTLSKNGKRLSYMLDVKGADNVTMAHIHMAAMGKNGPPVVWLYGSKMHPANKKGMVSGMLAKGTITASQLIGPLKGKPLSALVKAMHDGDAYVNVHTKAHPAGELRGEIK